MQWIFGIAEHCDSLDSDYSLLENLHPFAGDFGAIERNTGHVAPRTRKACDKTAAQRIGGGRHDNGNGGSLPFGCERRWCAHDDDGVGSEARKLCRKLVVGLRLTEHEPVFDCKVMTFDVAKVAKPAEQCLLKVRVGGGGEITQTRRPRSLLRPRRERPRRRAADERDELAALQMIELHSVPSHRTGTQDIRLARISRTNVQGATTSALEQRNI